MPVITVHQPEHSPWLGFFNKMMNADVFVYLHNCQYRKNYFQNRNRVRGPNGHEWITVPVVSKGLSGKRIDEVEISYSERNWKRVYIERIRRLYKRAPFFESIMEGLEPIIESAGELLYDLNLSLIDWYRGVLGIQYQPTWQSGLLEVDSTGSLRNAELVENAAKVSEDWLEKSYWEGTGVSNLVYLSGPSGRDYLDFKDFSSRGIEVWYSDFQHPEYRQLHDPFLPYCSILDLLMNYSPEDAREIILSGTNITRG